MNAFYLYIFKIFFSTKWSIRIRDSKFGLALVIESSRQVTCFFFFSCSLIDRLQCKDLILLRVSSLLLFLLIYKYTPSVLVLFVCRVVDMCSGLRSILWISFRMRLRKSTHCIRCTLPTQYLEWNMKWKKR